MLVTFSCSEYENITMFGDIALNLIKIMGHSATVPGAILAEDISEALENLQQHLAKTKGGPSKIIREEDEDEPQVSLSNRALPLINMLKVASQKKCNVMWK